MVLIDRFDRIKHPVLYLLLLLILVTQSAFQQTDLVVVQDELELNFPENLTFNLEIEAETVIEKVTLIYSSEMRTCQSRSARKDIEFDPAAGLFLEWEWDFSRDSTLPPGAVVEWQWEITDSNGKTTLTEPKSMVIQDQRYDWHQISEDGITLQWLVGDDSFGSELHKIALDSLDHIPKLMGIEIQDNIWITVYPSSDEVQEAVKFSADWVGGVAFPNHNTMIISGKPGQEEWLSLVIPHELTHLLVDSHTFNCKGAWLPRWFTEGMAAYAEDVLEQDEREQIREAYQSDSIPGLRSLIFSFSQDSEDAQLAYLVSQAAVEYLIQEYGSEKMGELLEQLGSGEMIDPALEAVYGLDTDRLDAAWKEDFGFEVEGLVVPLESVQATDEPLPTLALWTSAVQMTATATIAPQHTPQSTNTPVPRTELPITPTNSPEEISVSNQEHIGNNIGLIIAGTLLIIGILTGVIILMRRRKLR